MKPALLDLRYRGGAHGKSWFLKANEPGGRRAVWVGNTTVDFGTARFARGVVHSFVDGCTLSLEGANRTIDSGGRCLSWDLSVGPTRAAEIHHVPLAALYKQRSDPHAEARNAALRRAGGWPQWSATAGDETPTAR